jgi:protein-tyrosine phosphatase
MFSRILVVCDGNICRSPTAAALLQQQLPQGQISSAGLIALVGHDMDDTARSVALEKGLLCPPHQARQLDGALCAEADLILVMEQRQREKVMQRFPAGSGKVFLLTHWNGGQDIPDPYRRDRDTFSHVYTLMEDGVAGWRPRLN